MGSQLLQISVNSSIHYLAMWSWALNDLSFLDNYEVVWGGLGRFRAVWGVLGWFGVNSRTDLASVNNISLTFFIIMRLVAVFLRWPHGASRKDVIPLAHFLHHLVNDE